MFFWIGVLVGGHWVWIGVGCPCPPVRNDIVTPRQILFKDLIHICVNSDVLRDHWNKKTSVKKNLKGMGLCADPNQVRLHSCGLKRDWIYMI